MSNLREHVIQHHIEEHYPNARIVPWNEADSGLRFYTSDELKQVEGDWFPLACYLDEQSGKVVYGGREGIVHTYTEGETGCGKTTRFVMQNLRALSSLKEKPSFFVVDMHGEIVENLYDHLKENGYEIKILNCDDPDHSDTYNPFLPIARRCLKEDKLTHDALNQIRKIAELMQPVKSKNDPIWEIGARSYTNGLILSMFEDVLYSRIHETDVNFYSLIELHYWLRGKLNSEMGLADLYKISHFGRRPKNALSLQKMMSVTNNAEKTRASYFGVVENHFDAFGHPALYHLSSSNTIEIEDFIKKPTALFIQAGNTTISDSLISLLMNEIYSTVVEMGKKQADKRLPRKIHCFLDEFANCHIAEGPEFIKMLTTSRKFGLYWHLLLQCDVQLDSKYGQDIGKIIRANCTEIYMGSHDYGTTVRFAQSCGRKTVESLASRIAGQIPSLETMDLMTPDKLSLIENGCIFVKMNRRPLLKSYYEASYLCPEFNGLEDPASVYPVNATDYESNYTSPESSLPNFCDEELDIMLYLLKNGRTSIQNLVEMFGEEVHHYLAVGLELNVNTYDTHLPYEERSVEYAGVTAGQLLLLERKREEKRKRQAENNPRGFRYEYNEDDEYADDEDDEFDEDDPFAANKIVPPTNVWMDDEEDWDMDEPSPFMEELEAQLIHLRDNAELKRLDELTCVPFCLKEVFRILCVDYATERYPYRLITENVFHFEIIEEFIRRNNFPDKEGWMTLLEQEVEEIQEIPYFSDSLKKLFVKAVDEMDDLTLGNIKEIKRILSDTEE